jgi:hypothetical protein
LLWVNQLQIAIFNSYELCFVHQRVAVLTGYRQLTKLTPEEIEKQDGFKIF